MSRSDAEARDQDEPNPIPAGRPSPLDARRDARADPERASRRPVESRHEPTLELEPIERPA